MAQAKRKTAAAKKRAAATKKKKTAAAKKAAASKKKKAAAKKVSSANGKKPGTKRTRGTGAVKGELPYPMKLRGNLLLRFRAAAAEHEAANANYEAAKARLSKLLSEVIHRPVLQAMQTRDEFAADLSKKLRSFAEVQIECGKKLGIPPDRIKDYQYNTETGAWLPITPP